MRDFGSITDLPVGIEDDSHKKIKIFATEIPDYTQLSRFVCRSNATALDLVTQPL